MVLLFNGQAYFKCYSNLKINNNKNKVFSLSPKQKHGVRASWINKLPLKVSEVLELV